MNKILLLCGVAALAVGVGAAIPNGDARAQENRDIVVTAASIESGVRRAPTSWFRRVPSLAQPELSPDGNKLIVRLSRSGKQYLAWIDLTATNRTPVLIAEMEEYRDAGDKTIGSVQWVGNNTVVLETASREILFGQRTDLTRLVAYDLATRRRTELAWDGAGGGASDILHTDHVGGKILLQRDGFRNGSFTRPEVVEVDVATGRFTYVVRDNPVIGGWAADANGVVRLGFGYDADSGRRRIVYRRNAGDQFRTIFNEADPSFTDAGLNPQWIDPDSDMAIVRDNKSGFAKLYRVNLATLDYGEPIFESAGYDVGNIVGSFSGSKVLGYSVIEQRERVQWVDPLRQELENVLEESFGDGNVTIESSNEAETKFVISVGAANQGGAFYLFDTQSGRLSMLGNRWQHVGMTEMNPVSAFRYRASDGVEIEAIMTMPRHRRATTGLPMVILTHGGPFGPRDEIRYDGWSQALAEMGYVVVQPNYRGSGGYGANFIKMGRDNGFGLRMQDDLDDVITHLAAQGTIDPGRVCMMGWSYGGYASARAAQRNPDKYRCTIAGAGVYDLAAMREYDSRYLGSFGSGYLSKGAAELSSVSPTRNTEGRWAPILVVHGVRDARVPIDQARGLVSRLRGSGKRAGEEFDYIEQPQNTHNLNYDDVWVEWLEGAERWLTRYNPAYIDSDSDRPVPVAAEGERPTVRR